MSCVGGSDDRALTCVSRTGGQMSAIANQPLHRIGVVGRDKGKDVAPQVKDETDPLARPLRVQVRLVARVGCTPDPPHPSHGGEFDTPNCANRCITDAFGSPGKVVGPKTHIVWRACDPSVLVVDAHTCSDLPRRFSADAVSGVG